MSNQSHQNGYKLNRTGLIYDPLMLEYDCLFDENYPEKPDRIKCPYERCQFYGLTEKCINIPGRFSTDDEVEKCHTARVNKLMKDSEKMKKEELYHLSTIYDSMYFHQNSNKAARFALGSSIELLDQIMSNKVDNGFAIIRPPGHHAMHDEPNGYCYFNNAAVVARLAIEKYKLERVLIVDWDVHHGQGTQYQFYDDPKVLYFSMHRYDYGRFWPNLRQSDFDYIGEGAGKGYNINIPLNQTGLGNTEYTAAFHHVLLPIAYEYKPELVIVSSGYDAAIGCFEGKMRITPACYAHLSNSLSCLSDGKLCVLLEGDYCIKSLSEGVALSVRSLLGYPTPRIESLAKPHPVFVQTLMNLITCLRPHWKCLQGFNDNDSVSLRVFLDKWDNDYRKDKDIPFYSYENRPATFELDCYTHLSFDVEEKKKLEKAIDDLIVNTDLSFPKHNTCLSIGDSDKALLDKTILDRVVSVSSQSELASVLDSIGSKSSLNGLVVLKSTEKHGVVDSLVSAKQKFTQFKKVLVVELCESHLCSNDETFLFASLNSKAEGKNRISLNTSEINDATLISYFLKIVMPIAYQFNPDLVVLSADFNTAKGKATVSLVALTNVIRMLSALANGNLVLIFERNDDFNSIVQTINKSLSILVGDSCQALPALVASETVKKAIKDKIENLKVNWDCFQFGDKLPHA